MYAFIAIVAHYVNINGELGMFVYLLSIPDSIFFAEELLIDFRELLGAHSGENIADTVWETLVMYGIEAQVSQ